jgi:hypothetical protein
MKLYTEEQVRKAIRVAGQLVWEDEEIFASLPSIELPKDEDIDRNIEKLFYGEKKYYFKAGIEWTKQQILNQNK